MIKANAYGLGAQKLVQIFASENVSDVGVVMLEEGIALREIVAAPKLNILVYGAYHKSDAEIFVKHKLTPVMSSWESLNDFEETLPVPIPVHLKFNTGMNRLGFSTSDCDELAGFFKKSKKLKLVGVLTHLLQSEDFGQLSSRSVSQLEEFLKTISRFRDSLSSIYSSIPIHALNTAGILAWSALSRSSSSRGENGESHQRNRLNSLMREMAHLGGRPGIGIYGWSPQSENFVGAELGKKIEPVVEWSSEICHLQTVAKGETVSYMGTWTASQDSLIGVVACGYGDGFSRRLSNKGFVLVRGHRLPIRGIVCMDYFMVDLTSVNQNGDFKVGEPVVLIGNQGQSSISLSDFAEMAETIPYEILTGISSRVTRRYLD